MLMVAQFVSIFFASIEDKGSSVFTHFCQGFCNKEIEPSYPSAFCTMHFNNILRLTTS
jgi:hypothetical protein